MIDRTTSALVLYSGGQDSGTCLAWALKHCGHVETIGFDYGQRHDVEMECRLAMREKMAALNPAWEERLGPDHIVSLQALNEVSETSLTRDSEITMLESGLPSTFVPGRNLIFLNFAAALGYRRGITTLVGGMCESDFSGYPDCRRETLDATMQSISLGMDKVFKLETPLMRINKAGAWELTRWIGGDDLIELIRVESHTCYNGVRDTLHDWGYGCGDCPACELRAKGWLDYSESRA